MDRGSISRWAVLTVAALVLGAAGCQSSSGGAGSASGSGTGSEFREEPVRSTASDVGAADVLQPVYFDFDSYGIRRDAKSVLKQNAGAIKENDGWGRVTIEGHCDERGSEEYNLALGERRANSVRVYLVDLGVPSSRLRTVSFGEAKPAVMGHDESAWRYNRRSNFAASR